MTAGRMVSILIAKPTAAGFTSTNQEIDKQLSGSYLVTAVTHEFNLEEYTISMEVKKDSTILDLEGPVNFRDAVKDDTK